MASECRKLRYNNNVIYKSINPTTSRSIEATNLIRNRVMCYKCNNFGHIARDHRLQTNQFGPRYGNRVIACHIYNNLGHTI